MKTKIIYEPIPKTVGNHEFDQMLQKALLLSIKEKGFINHSQYFECIRRIQQ